MTKQEAVEHWRNRAASELNAAQILLQKNDPSLYAHVLFHCHLCAEMTLKAAYTEKFDDAPPYTHDLSELASLLQDDWSNDQQAAFEQLSSFAVLARYGDQEWFESQATEENATLWLNRVDEFLSSMDI